MQVERGGRSFVRYLFLLILILILPIFLVKEYRLICAKKSCRLTPYSQLQSQGPLIPSFKQITLMVLTCHEGEQLLAPALDALMSQCYPSYQIVYIDRGDQQIVGPLLQRYRQNNCGQLPITLHQVESDREAFYRYAQVVNSLNSDELVVHLKGADLLVDEHVLTRINHNYAKPNLLLAYGKYQRKQEPRIKIENSAASRTNVAYSPWDRAGVKIFYAGLFQKFHAGTDLFAIDSEEQLFAPFQSLSQTHKGLIPEVLSIHHLECADGVKHSD